MFHQDLRKKRNRTNVKLSPPSSSLRQKTLIQAQNRSRKHEPNPECLALLEQAFELYNTSSAHPGSITRSELEELAQSLGLSLPSLPAGSDALFGLSDFMAIMREALTQIDQRRGIDQTFDMFAEGSSHIELRHLKKVADELGDQTLAEHDLQEMIQHASDGTGKVSREAFLQLMNY